MANRFITSIIYPFITEDAMQAVIAELNRANLLTVPLDNTQVPVPSLQPSTLVVSIAYLTYDHRPWPDEAEVPVPSIESGTLVVTILYVSYGPAVDDAEVPVPEILSGTLVVTIIHVTYDYSVTYPDNAQVPVPSIQSGTLV